MHRKWPRAAWSVILAAGMGCSEGVQPAGTGEITVRLTGGSPAVDLSLLASSMSPPGADLIASATVEIGAVELVGPCPAEDTECEDGAIVTVTEDAGTFNLMDFQNGVNATLGTATVPAGTYFQARLVVESASVTLVDGVTFPDGSSTADLFVPSGAQSGIKINLDDGDEDPGVTVADGGVIVLLELDVSRNFVLTGPPDQPLRALFTPSIRQVPAE